MIDRGKPILAIVNPASANGATARFWPQAREVISRAGVSFDEAVTAGPGDAVRLARQAGEAGYGVVLYVGGDGTANEVANGVLQLPPEQRPALAALPRGTGADLPKSLRLDPGPEAAAARLLAGNTRQIDAAVATFTGPDGRTVQRYFVNIADAGIGGYVAERVNRTTKTLGGFVSFLWATLVEFVRLHTPDLTLTVDGRVRFSGPAVSVAVCNGPRFGGGMKMAPQAELDDGVFDIVIIADIGTLDLMVSLPRLYRGTHLTHRKVRSLQGTEILVESDLSRTPRDGRGATGHHPPACTSGTPGSDVRGLGALYRVPFCSTHTALCKRRPDRSWRCTSSGRQCCHRRPPELPQVRRSTPRHRHRDRHHH